MAGVKTCSIVGRTGGGVARSLLEGDAAPPRSPLPLAPTLALGPRASPSPSPLQIHLPLLPHRNRAPPWPRRRKSHGHSLRLAAPACPSTPPSPSSPTGGLSWSSEALQHRIPFVPFSGCHRPSSSPAPPLQLLNRHRASLCSAVSSPCSPLSSPRPQRARSCRLVRARAHHRGGLSPMSFRRPNGPAPVPV